MRHGKPAALNPAHLPERSVSVAVMALCVIAVATPVFAQENDASRDAEIFGTTDPAPAQETGVSQAVTGAAEPGRPSEDEIFGDSTQEQPDQERQGGAPVPEQLSQEAGGLEQRVGEKDDTLDIGGLAYLRGSYAYPRVAAPKNSPLRAPSFLDLYTDARPSERVRVFARGRLRYDFALAETGATDSLGQPLDKQSADLDQFWLKFDVERQVFITAGKQPLKWGSGRFWNPTDFVNPALRDPLAAFDERLGVNLVKVHYPFEKIGGNLYAIADLEGVDELRTVGGALRGELAMETSEVAISAAARENQPLRLGFDVSTGIWDLDFRLETAVRHNDQAVYYEGTFEPARLRLPRQVDRSDDWIPQVVGGVEYAFNYSDEDSLAVGLEYFYNESGYENADFYPWLLFNGAFRPLYNGKHYGGAYMFLAGPGDWDDTTIIASTLGNLSDESYLARLDYRLNFLTYINLDTFVNYHFGDNGEFNFGLRVPPVPIIPQLRSGLRTEQPLVDLGVGLRVAF